jgi:hypothetical protein
MEIENEVKALREEVEALRLLLEGAINISTNENVGNVLCKATTAAGKPCTHRAKPGGNGFCGMHGRPSQLVERVRPVRRKGGSGRKRPVVLVHGHGFGEPGEGCMVCARYRTGGGWEVGK